MRRRRRGSPVSRCYKSIRFALAPLPMRDFSHPPKIVFLLAVMIGNGDRRPAEPVGRCRRTWPGLRLTGAARYLNRMRVVGTGIDTSGSGHGPRERQGDRSGRELRALDAGDVVVANRAPADVLN